MSRVNECNPYTPPETIDQAGKGAFFPRERPGVHNYASRWLRLLGSIIDGVIMIGIVFILDLIVAGRGSLIASLYDEDAEYMTETWVDGHWGTLVVFILFAEVNFHFWRTRGKVWQK